MDRYWLIWIGIGYLAGSIPFGLLIGMMRGVDIRQAGSGNIGATNAGRVLGKTWGIACFLLDVFKGFTPVFIAGSMRDLVGRANMPDAEAWSWLAVAAAAILGHVFPVWLKFKGGKGVATGFGVLVGVWPALAYPVLVALAVWIIVVRLSQYVSLASMAAAVSLPVTVTIIALLRDQAIEQRLPFLIVTVAMALLVVITHRSNVTRLLAGTESKIGTMK